MLCGASTGEGALTPAVQEVGHLDHAAEDPADRIAQAHHQRRIGHEAGDDEQVDLAYGHEGGQHDDHGGPGIAPAAQGAGQRVVDAVCQQEEGVGPQEQHAELDHRGILGEQPHGGPGEDEQEQRYDQRDAHGQGDAGDGAPVGALLLFSADVLADEGRGGHGGALHRQQDELVQLVVAAPPGHAAGAEGVDVGLHEHVGEGGDHRLDGRGQAHGEHPLQDRAVDAQVPPDQAVDVLSAGQQPERQHGRDQLGEDRGVGDARDARLQAEDEGQVQYDVQHAGQDQEHQRAGGIAHGPEDAAAHVVDQQAGEAQEVDAQVGDGVLEHVVGGGHQPQHRAHAGQPNGGEQGAEHEREGHGGLDGVVQALHVPRAEVLGDDHARASGEAVEEEHQHVDDHRGGAHGGEGLLAHEVAHDDAVHGVVQHLEDVPQHQRQGEQQDLADDGAAGHVACGAGGDSLHFKGPFLGASGQAVDIDYSISYNDMAVPAGND